MFDSVISGFCPVALGALALGSASVRTRGAEGVNLAELGCRWRFGNLHAYHVRAGPHVVSNADVLVDACPKHISECKGD